MKQRILRALALAVTGVIGIIAGRVYENGRTVPRATVKRSESHTFLGGELLISDVVETKGWAIVNFGEDFSQLEWTRGESQSPVTLYRVRRSFKEHEPCVSGLVVEDHGATWTDGLYDFELAITPRHPAAEPRNAADSR